MELYQCLIRAYTYPTLKWRKSQATSVDEKYTLIDNAKLRK
jgi:hypothetical protein